MKYRRESRVTDLLMSDLAKATLYQERGDRTPQFPADKMYKVDPTFSRRPTALCENAFLGLPVCSKGVGRECFCRIPCAQQYALTATEYGGPYASEEVEQLAKEAVRAAKKHSRDVMRSQRPEMEMTDSALDRMVAWIMEGFHGD